jgi:hypothetical protein
VKFAAEKHPSGQRAKGTATYIAGTGRYAGISGAVDYTTEAGSAFRSITEGTYVGVIALNGHYKLP